MSDVPQGEREIADDKRLLDSLKGAGQENEDHSEIAIPLPPSLPGEDTALALDPALAPADASDAPPPIAIEPNPSLANSREGDVRVDGVAPNDAPDADKGSIFTSWAKPTSWLKGKRKQASDSGQQSADRDTARSRAKDVPQQAAARKAARQTPACDQDLAAHLYDSKDGTAGKAQHGANTTPSAAPTTDEPPISLSPQTSQHVNLSSPDTPPSDTPIPPSRSLVVGDFAPPSLKPTERLMRFAYRLGVPAHALTSPFRKVPRTRLIATVSSPLRGNRMAGVALRAGHFLIFGVKAPIAQLDFKSGASLSPPFERTIHGFTWLADLAASAPREQCLPTAERVIGRWLSANPQPGKGPAWTPELAGLRLLSWLVYAPLVFGGKDHAQRDRAVKSMTDTARWLDRNVTRGTDGIGELAGWCALVAAGLLLSDGKARRLFGEAGLVRCLGDLVSEDGGVLSRSPLAQMQAIALLIDLSACYRAVGEDPPGSVSSMLELLLPPLLALVHSDGALGSWQGGGAIEAEQVARLVTASGVRTRPLKDVRQWGYQRVLANKSVLQFDAAPPPLARNARDGCASTLAFELSAGSDRIIVNCGGAAMTGGQVPTRIEQGLRATAAHSTLVLSDTNSTAIRPRGGLGSGVSEVEVDRRVLELKHGRATRLEASHNGYVASFGLVHRRILILRDNGEELRGEDMLVASGRRGKTSKIAYAIRFHLGPDVEAVLAEDGRGAWLALGDGSHWQFRIPQGKLLLEESLWVDGMGRPRPIQQIVIQGMVARGGGSFSWLLKKMG